MLYFISVEVGEVRISERVVYMNSFSLSSKTKKKKRKNIQKL